MINRPFFSIVIPTHNRADLLYFAVKSFLQQDFGDFEIIISDNNSTDNTKDIIKKFNDKRIKYSKNVTNIGFIENIKKAILKTKGRYVITHGSDDVILFKNTLSRIYSLITKKRAGFIRINVLSKERSNSKIKHVWINERDDIYIEPNLPSLDIVNFLEKTNVVFISGLVFKNENIIDSDFINSEISPWFNLLFKQTKKYGAYFLSNLFLVSSWSGGGIGGICTIDKNNKLYFTNYFNNIIKNILGDDQIKEYESEYYKKILKDSLFLLPTIKYLSSNKNLIEYKNAMSNFNKKIASSLYFLFFYYLSLVLPKKVISFIRSNIHYLRKDTQLTISNVATKKEIVDIEKNYQEIIKN